MIVIIQTLAILVKDNIDVTGFPTTAGSLALEDNVAKSDAPVIRNLRKNGAVIIGKTNLTEFANYVSPRMPCGYSSRGGQVIHAVNPNLNPLGSSTGSVLNITLSILQVEPTMVIRMICLPSSNGMSNLPV